MLVNEALGFFSTKINIGQFFGRKPEEVYITMNEPNEDDQFSMNDKERNTEILKKLWKKCIDGEKHNFEFEEKQADGSIIVKPASKEQIVQIISKKGICLAYIIGQWYGTLPLPTSNAEK